MFFKFLIFLHRLDEERLVSNVQVTKLLGNDKFDGYFCLSLDITVIHDLI